MSTMTNKDVMHAASMFAREHVRECCAEICEWQDTGLLSNGRVRELAKMLRPIDGISTQLSVAESIVQRVALDHLAQPAQSVAAKDAEIERLTRGNIGYAQDNVNLTRLAETKLAYLRERGYTQQAVVMTGPGGCCTVSNLGRVIWLKDPSELAITGAERTAKQIHDEAGMPPNP